jgi:hypothetical protein
MAKSNPTSGCPDLRQLAGDLYRVANELEGRKAHVTDDPWDLIVPGRGGFVGVWGDDRLVACTRGWGTTRKLLAWSSARRWSRTAPTGRTWSSAPPT